MCRANLVDAVGKFVGGLSGGGARFPPGFCGAARRLQSCWEQTEKWRRQLPPNRDKRPDSPTSTLWHECAPAVMRMNPHWRRSDGPIIGLIGVTG